MLKQSPTVRIHSRKWFTANRTNTQQDDELNHTFLKGPFSSLSMIKIPVEGDRRLGTYIPVNI
jgi:hypothetical protein